MSFDSSIPVGSPQLSLIDTNITGTAPGDFAFSQTASGSTVDEDGKPLGRLYVEYFGEVHGNASSLSIWLFVKTPTGTYHYEAAGILEAAVQATDGSTTITFSAPYHLVDGPSPVPDTPTDPMPHDGIASLSMKVWVDGTSLYDSSLSLREVAAA
jgi:hypothetical protein